MNAKTPRRQDRQGRQGKKPRKRSRSVLLLGCLTLAFLASWRSHPSSSELVEDVGDDDDLVEEDVVAAAVFGEGVADAEARVFDGRADRVFHLLELEVRDDDDRRVLHGRAVG